MENLQEGPDFGELDLPFPLTQGLSEVIEERSGGSFDLVAATEEREIPHDAPGVDENNEGESFECELASRDAALVAMAEAAESGGVEIFSTSTT